MNKEIILLGFLLLSGFSFAQPEPAEWMGAVYGRYFCNFEISNNGWEGKWGYYTYAEYLADGDDQYLGYVETMSGAVSDEIEAMASMYEAETPAEFRAGMRNYNAYGATLKGSRGFNGLIRLYIRNNPDERDEVIEVLGGMREDYMNCLRSDLQYPKSETPGVQLYLMSHCPYANQMETELQDVIAPLEGDIDFEPIYIIYDERAGSSFNTGNPECLVYGSEPFCSLFGLKGINQDIREKMVYNRYGEAKWAEYASAVDATCTSETIDTCWAGVADDLGIDSADITADFESEKFGILADDKGDTFATHHLGSPVLVINGRDYYGDRTSESMMAAICSAFEVPPAACT